MIRDEPRNDGLASIVDDLRATGGRDSGGRTDGDDVPVADDDCGVVKWSPAASINHASATKDSGLGVRNGECADNERYSKSDQRAKWANATHS
jgi:hypothetical protein